MAFLSTLLVAALFFVQSVRLGTSSGTAGSQAAGTKVPLRALIEASRDTPNPSSKVPGRYFQGLFVLCEGPTPTARLFTTRSRLETYPFSFSPACRLVSVDGKVGATVDFDRAKLWNREFTGIDFFYEVLIKCDFGQVFVQRRVGNRTTTVFSCGRPFEVHAVRFGI